MTLYRFLGPEKVSCNVINSILPSGGKMLIKHVNTNQMLMKRMKFAKYFKKPILGTWETVLKRHITVFIHIESCSVISDGQTLILIQ